MNVQKRLTLSLKYHICMSAMRKLIKRQKLYLIFLASIILVIPILGQQTVDTINHIDYVQNFEEEINNYTSKFEKEIDSIKNQMGIIVNFKQQQEEVVKQTGQTIENQNSLIASFGIIYTILTIIIALIAIVLPLITYFFGIKPSRDALKEVESNMDKKIEKYLKEIRTQQIKKSVEHLKGENSELRAQAISFLMLTQYEGFTDAELFEFYNLIKLGKLNEYYVGNLASLLASRVNNYANEIFSDKEYMKNNTLKVYAYQYISKTGYKSFFKPLKSFLENNDNNQDYQYIEFVTFLSSANLNTPELVKDILNDKELVGCLSSHTLKCMRTGISEIISNEEFSKTYLMERIKKIVNNN